MVTRITVDLFSLNEGDFFCYQHEWYFVKQKAEDFIIGQKRNKLLKRFTLNTQVEIFQ